LWLLAGGVLAITAAASAGAGCDSALLASYGQAERVVASLHADKPSQMRVLALDGSVYTAGETQWLKGQLRQVSAACQRSDSESAGTILTDVERALASHRTSLQD
jgi:hypothetical protein